MSDGVKVIHPPGKSTSKSKASPKAGPTAEETPAPKAEETATLNLRGINFRYHLPSQNPLLFWRKRLGPGVHEIDLQLERGQIIGLVGPNGAGKTTLMKILAGIVAPDSGRVTFEGRKIICAENSARGNSQIGFMPEQVVWPSPGTPRSALTWISTLRNGASDIPKLLKLVGLNSRADDPLDSLSQGMRRRLSLACALLGNPQILILDEPMNGLDPVAQTAFRNLLDQLANKGHTILVSSHMLAELESFVKRIVVMHRGQIIIEGTLEELEKSLGLSLPLSLSGSGNQPEEILNKYFKSFENTSPQKNGWSVQGEFKQKHGQYEGNNRNDLIRKMVSELTEIGSPPHSVETTHHNLSSILAASTGMDSDEIGLDLDEHVMVPLAKISIPVGGEEE